MTPAEKLRDTGGTASSPEPAGSSAGVPDVHPELMDCLQVNLAVLADEWHGPGTHLRLGARLRLARHTTETELPTAEPTVDEHLADARDLLGLVPARRWTSVPAADVESVLRPDGPTYVVADAYTLPWTPYARQRHMSHSFLVVPVDGGYDIVDAYHNDTPWGRARPVRFRLGDGESPIGLSTRAEEVLWLDSSGPLRPWPAPTVEGLGPEAIDSYLWPFQDATQALARLAALDQLVLESWLLERSRRLHVAYLEAYLEQAGTPLSPAAAGHLAGWAKTREALYLTLRRAQRGAAVPAGTIGQFAAQVRADAELFGGEPKSDPEPVAKAPSENENQGPDQPGADRAGTATTRSTARQADPNWPAFATLLARVLGVPAADLAGLDSLADVPSATSLRVVEIVEGLEGRFGVQFGAGDLEPERLYDIDHLLALLRRTGAADPSDEVTP